MNKQKLTKLTALGLALVMMSGLCACGADNTGNTGDAGSGTPSNSAAGGSGSDQEGQPSTRTITDMLGREVEIPAEINTIICTGSNALRMVTYLQATDLMVGVEETDQGYETSTKRDYAHACYDAFKDMPVIGKGGGTAYTAYPEEVLKAAPDVILTCFVQEAAEQLQNETGIPVVSIRCPSSNFIDENWYAALRLTAELVGREDRCEELLRYIDGCKADLAERSSAVDEDSKPTVYTGAVTFSGAHGFAGTYANFGPFLAIGAKNVADETDEASAFEVDLEKVVVWDPDIIFLDPGNMNLVNGEYASNPDFFHSLTAVQNGEIYTMPSFNNYSTNITYCLMDAYFAGKVLYPDQFADVDMRTKGNEILTEFLGTAFFDEMEADGLYYGKLTLGE